MLAECDAVESGHRLALASRGDKCNILWAISSNIPDVDKNAIGQIHIAKLGSSADNVYHTSAKNGNLSAVVMACVDNLLNTVNVRGERSNNKSSVLVLRENARNLQAYMIGGQADLI